MPLAYQTREGVTKGST